MAGFVPVNYGVPSIDNTAMANWTPQQVDLYAKLPYYLERATAEQRRWFATLKPLITGRISWKENMGSTMRRVMVEDSPILRQWATPNVLSQIPKTDIVGVRERTVEASLRWQNFQTPTFNFRSSFEDFMRGNIEPHRKALTKGMEVFEEMFYLTHLIAYAPYVWVAGHGLVGYDLNFFFLDLTNTACVRSLRTDQATYTIFCQAEDREFVQIRPVFLAMTTSLLSNLQQPSHPG